MCYTENINKNGVNANPFPSLDKLVETFLRRGGHINQYYLDVTNRNKHAIVFLNKWVSGKNIREALIKALGKE